MHDFKAIIDVALSQLILIFFDIKRLVLFQPENTVFCYNDKQNMMYAMLFTKPSFSRSQNLLSIEDIMKHLL